MADSKQPETPEHRIYHPIFAVLLVVLESITTLLLRIDIPLRLSLKPLIAEGIWVKFICHQPNLIFYGQFTPKGLLLDFIKPTDTDTSATIFLPSLFRLDIYFLTNRLKKRIRMVGNAQTITALNDALTQLSIAAILNKWFAIDRLKSTDYLQALQPLGKRISDALTKEYKLQHLNNTLSTTVQTQQQALDAFVVSNKEKDYHIKILKRKLRRITIFSLLLLFTVIILGIYIGFTA